MIIAIWTLAGEGEVFGEKKGSEGQWDAVGPNSFLTTH